MSAAPTVHQTRDFYDDIAEKMEQVRQNLNDSVYYNRHRSLEWRYIASKISMTGHPRILDVGCGPSPLLTELGQRPDYDYVGLDIAQRAFDRSQSTDRTDFTLGSAQALPFSNGSFDVVLASHLIEHLHNPEILLMECHRVLKKNGMLIIATPNKNSRFKGRIVAKSAFVAGTAVSFCLSILAPGRFIRLLNDFSSARKAGMGIASECGQEEHVHEFSVPELVSAIGAGGFRIVDTRFSGLHPFMYSLALNDLFGGVWSDIVSVLEKSPSGNLKMFALDITLTAERE